MVLAFNDPLSVISFLSKDGGVANNFKAQIREALPVAPSANSINNDRKWFLIISWSHISVSDKLPRPSFSVRQMSKSGKTKALT
jgi:hypothetical protein